MLLGQFPSFSLAPCEPAVAQTISISNPHKGYQYNYKGNLHAHSSNIDGTDPPATVGQWYKDNGYDFYAITDHDYVTPDPNVGGIIWMGGAEEDSHDGSSGHMNHINVTSPINSGTDQERINNVQNQGGGSILNHPVAPGKGWSAATIAALDGALGMEVYNGSGANSSSIWDTVLSSEKIIWGTASDDSHSSGGRGTAYIVVNSNNSSPTKEEILTQMRAGNFYASRGFNLSVSIASETITTQTTNGNKIRWIKKSGEVIKTTNAQSDTYTVNGLEKYVRIEILDASGNTKAWSQPLTVSGGINTSGFVLDGWGGIHPFGGASLNSGGTGYWKGWDIAKDIAICPNGKSGYVLDGWGGVHPFGGAPKITSPPPYWGWNIARRIKLVQ